MAGSRGNSLLSQRPVVQGAETGWLQPSGPEASFPDRESCGCEHRLLCPREQGQGCLSPCTPRQSAHRVRGFSLRYFPEEPLILSLSTR